MSAGPRKTRRAAGFKSLPALYVVTFDLSREERLSASIPGAFTSIRAAKEAIRAAFVSDLSRGLLPRKEYQIVRFVRARRRAWMTPNMQRFVQEGKS